MRVYRDGGGGVRRGLESDREGQGLGFAQTGRVDVCCDEDVGCRGLWVLALAEDGVIQPCQPALC